MLGLWVVDYIVRVSHTLNPHHYNSDLARGDKDIKSKFTLFSHKGLGFIFFQVSVAKGSMHDPAGKLATIFVITLVAFRIEGEEVSNNITQNRHS